MLKGSPKPVRLGDYTSAPLELSIVAFTILPFCAPAYFRVPLMALDTRLV